MLCLIIGNAVSQPPKKSPAVPPAAGRKVDFVRDIQPLFASRCVRCHGPDKAEGGLRLDRKEDALAGSNSGPVLTPGKSAASRLIHLVAGQDKDLVMPPSGKRLTADQVGMLRAWIDQGMIWPAQAGTSEKPAGSGHWAFQPVRRPAVPAVKNSAWARNPIDRFILARLEKEKVRPSPEADRVTLVRRLSFDLRGLPPTPAEVDAFLADTRPHAYERLVDRLLDSPHYGERWGRHWLDTARYADSDGYNADAARPIWKYRDWVINALNRDMPFDQFVIEQMAGDLLPGATVEQKIATGFHRNTLFNAEGGNDPEEFRVERVVDRVATTGVVFLGLTLGCAECHAHKYDPISQREFYQLFAFFNNAEELKLETPTAEEQTARAKFHAELAEWQVRLKAHDRTEALRPASDRIARGLGFLAGVPGGIHGPLLVNVHLARDPIRQGILRHIADLKKREPRVTTTLVLVEVSAKPRLTRIHIRGNFRRPGALVSANVPRVLPPLPAGKAPTRLDLARWLVDRSNPLPARVTVNRLWQRYFGAGLVETENDFGTQGKPPTHPELLDWLAAEFMGRGWSLKAMHRLLVTSATYRQASHQRKDLAAVDPHNRLLARQLRLRLEAEIVGDSLLAASGLLAVKIGGPSVFPYQPPGVMETRRSPFPWLLSAGTDRYRRGLYTHFWRTSPHPFLLAFDAPKADTSCTRRHRSNTPLQALMLLNDPMFLECARGLAARIAAQEAPAGDAARTRHAFRLCLAREPSPAEQDILHDLLTEQRQSFRADLQAAQKLAGNLPPGADVVEHAAWTAVARVLFNLDEMITRE